jgi:hypothetical protein
LRAIAVVAIERANPGSWVRTLTPGVGPGVLAELGIEPVDRHLQRVYHGQVVLDHLPRHRLQIQRGE